MRGRPIALQMLLVTIVTAVVLGLLLGTVVKELELSTLQKQLQRSSASTVAAVAAAAAGAIVSEDVPVLQTVAKEVLESQASIHQIIIENESGRLLAESRALDVPMEQSALVYSESVVYMGETFGSIQISWNMDQAMDQIAGYAWRAGVISALGVLVVSLILLLVVRRIVVQPMQLIAKRVSAIEHDKVPPKFKGEPAIELVVLNDAVDHLAEMIDALRGAERQYRQLFSNDITGNFISTPEGEIIDCNPAFIRMYGLASLEDAKQRGGLQLWGSSRGREKVIESLKEHGRLYHQEIQVQRVDGTLLFGLQNLVGICAENGELSQVQGYVMDVTEHHNVELQLRQAERMNALGRLAGGIAHDFNNSLTVILGHCELLLHQYSGNKDLAERLTAIRESVRRSASLTEQLRVLSHQERGESFVSDASDVLEEVLSMLHRIFGSGIDLEVNVDPNLGGMKIGAGSLESVVLNLVNNARDAMPDGGVISVSATLVELEDRESHWSIHWFDALPGPYVKISVVDSGCGMDEETVSQVFEPFFTTKHFSKGTGLGLSSVFGMVRRSGGGIEFQSSLGQGTRVDVWIPQIIETSVEVESVDDLDPEELQPAKTRSILVVDDESAIRALMHAVLEGAGHDIYEAADGYEAMACLGDNPEISVLISDLTMPGMSGKELITKARKLRPHLKVVAISGYVNSTDQTLTLPDGPVRSLCKPFGTSDLLESVASLFKH
ncbi:MAG: response regulator [Phycisphaerales bacterium]|nr:response regulator [Phycisphaerales bacterium]